MFLIVTRNFPPDIGGIQNLMGNLSESLLNHGPVKVFADEFEGSEKFDKNSLMDIDRIKGIKLFRKFRKASVVNNFISSKSNIRAVITDHWKSLELLKIENLKKTKTFCLLHSKEINHMIGTTLNSRMIRSLDKADFLIANSNYTKELAVKVGINKLKIHIIFPGIKEPKIISEEFKVQAKEIFADTFPKIITVSRLDKRKGHDKILMSIKNLKVKYPNIRYICIGFGKEEKNLTTLSNELDLNNHVRFLKNINENLKLALISEADLFLMPTRIEKKSVEGFGISFMEAASYSVPSIGGKDGGAADAITHEKTGLICDGNELNSIYESIINIFKNEKYIKYGKDAEIKSKDFYWDKIVKKYLNLIN